jgi:hypothetical protein
MEGICQQADLEGKRFWEGLAREGRRTNDIICLGAGNILPTLSSEDVASEYKTLRTGGMPTNCVMFANFIELCCQALNSAVRFAQ